jgi:hypothetical protein
MALFELIVLLVVLIISAIPLNIAVKLLGGKSGIIKVIFVNVLVGLVYFAIHAFIGLFAGLISFIAMLFIYKEMFRLGWLKAFFAWLLQGAIILIAILVLGFFGLALLLL